jgi:ABC-2 type transport system permease protein
LNPGFSQLRNATADLLDEMRRYSGGNLEYVFIDPSADPDEEARKALYRQLYQKGIQPVTFEERTAEGMERSFVFPGALVSYSNEEMPVQLLKSQLGVPREQLLHNSVQNLEFEFANAIRKATNPLRPEIGFLEGHGELDTLQVADMANTLKSSYRLKRVRIDGQLDALKGLRALVIARPDSVFDEKDKFVIDQFVMNGGRVVWLVDPVQAGMDSLQRMGGFMLAPARELKIEDMLFRYGARVNYDLVQDILSSLIVVVSGRMGDQAKQQLLPWYYFPVMTPKDNHPVVRNLNSVRGQFVSSVDPIDVPGVSATILLSTSQYSKVLPAPVRVSLGELEYKPDPSRFPNKDVPVAMLLEGDFTSVYKNRIPQAIENDSTIGFKESCTGGKMVVIGDGDLIRNDIVKGSPIALGYDRNTGTTFGNKAFFLNVIDYLCEGDGLISTRNKELRLRLIDPVVLESDTRPIRVLAVTLPIGLVVFLGLIKALWRKRVYSKQRA